MLPSLPGLIGNAQPPVRIKALIAVAAADEMNDRHQPSMLCIVCYLLVKDIKF
jgi:hypothetical protein